MRYAALLFLVSAVVAQDAAATLVRIADGDCVALGAALASVGVVQPPLTTPAGNGGTLIVLATRGHYDACQIVVSGNVTIDGAGASLALLTNPWSRFRIYAQIEVLSTGRLTMHDLNLGYPDGAGYQLPGGGGWTPLSVIHNSGSLTLDAVSVSGVEYAGPIDAAYVPGGASVVSGGALIGNEGQLVLRNASFVNNLGAAADLPGSGFVHPLISNTGRVEIYNSTFALNDTGANGLILSTGAGSVVAANSLIANAANSVCLPASGQAASDLFVSLGGNLTSDDSCGFRRSGDRVAADAGLAAFGDNGGLVRTVALSGSSAAARNGLAANCEAADARGTVRNVMARGGCDSGAYEFGGGRGLLSQGGMSGFFYDASADGHYVTVQRLDWGSALVVWNTFDKNGQAAWIYAIGEVSGNHIHAQGAQNLGGVLQPGGAQTGSHGFVWGDIDIDLQDCFGGTLSYNSPLPNFGSGQFALNRLAFLGDLDCSN